MNKIKNKTNWLVRSLLNKLMNITSDEWPRIAVSWLLQFFYRIGFIVGWTVLIVLFVSKYGILALPFFFIIYAVFRIFGSIFYSNLITRYNKDKIILITAIVGAVVFFLLSFFNELNMTAFIFIGIPALAVFFSQLYILNSGFIEELFSPLESERTFPIIESSETIGGIVGGLLVAIFSNFILTSHLIMFVVMSLILIIPVILFHRQLLKKLPFIHFKKKKTYTKFNINSLKESFKHMKSIPFLKVLLSIVVLQWIFFDLLEFQFMKALYQNLPGEAVHAEQELTHGLGNLQILFHSFALVMQLLIASRIISSLGIISSLLLHPVVSLLSLGTLLFKFGFSSAVLTKVNFEMTNVIYKNAYHTSYYAISPKIREQTREFLEGFAHPAGAIIGMTLLLLFQQIFVGSMLTYSVTGIMIMIMVLMLAVLLKNERQYTHLSIKNLLHSQDPVVQLNAVEVLGQKGHRNATDILLRTLNQDKVNNKVRIKILETLGHMKDKDSVLEILNSLNNSDRTVKTAALKALDKFDLLHKKSSRKPFSAFRANDLLKELFAQEHDTDIKSLIMNILAKLNQQEIVPFLLDLLESSDDKLKADCITICGKFKDINIVHFLLPYLDSKDPIIKGRTIIALWQFKKYQNLLMQELKKMLYSKDKKEMYEGFFVVGEVKAVLERNRLKESLQSEDTDEVLIAALALVKMNSKEAVPIIVEALINEDEDTKHLILGVKDSLSQEMQKYIDNHLSQKVSQYINNILANSNKTDLEALDKTTLIQLRNAYELVNEHEEVQNIADVLERQKKLEQSLQFNPA